MFEITIKQEDFYNALKKVSNTVGKDKDSNNMFTKTLYMCINKAKSGAFTLKLVTSTISDLSEIIIKVNSASEAGPCNALIEFERLYGIVSHIPKDKVLKISNPKEGVLNIDYEGKEDTISLNGLKADVFILPPEDTVENKFNVGHAAFKEAIDKAAAIIHESSSMAKFNNVNIIVKKEGLTILGYDTMYQVPVISTIAGAMGIETSFFVEVKKLKKLIGEFTPSLPIEISLTKNSIKIRQNNFRVTTRLSAEIFADITKLFPSKYEAELEIEKPVVLEALQRLYKLTEDEITAKKCNFEVSEDKIYMHLASKAGKNGEKVPSHSIGNKEKLPMKFVLNIAVLIEVIETVPGAKFLLSIATNNKGTKYCYIHPVGEAADTYKCSISELGS